MSGFRIMNHSLDLNDELVFSYAQPLASFDLNADKVITDDEMVYPTFVVIPGSSQKTRLTNPDGFHRYSAYVEHAVTLTRQFADLSLLDSAQMGLPLTTQSWFFKSPDSLNLDAPLLTNRGFGLKLLDVKKNENVFSFFFQSKTSCNAVDDYFFTLHFNADSTGFSVELAGHVFSLEDAITDPDLECWRAETLKALYSLFTQPVDFSVLEKRASLDSVQFNLIRDVLEALMLKADQKMWTNRSDVSIPPKELMSPEQKARQQAILEGKSPYLTRKYYVRGLDGEQRIYFQSEQELSYEEKNNLHDWLDLVPPEIIEVLMRTGRFDDWPFEVVDSDLAEKWPPQSWVMLQQHWPIGTEHIRFLLNRAYLTRPVEGAWKEATRDYVTHEFAHHFRINWGQTFLSKYLNNIRSQVTTSLFNPTVSPYALKYLEEFFAECVVAFFNGDEDEAPLSGYLYGPRSKRELAQKHPEFFLALRLYLEKDSPLFGNETVFAQENLKNYEDLSRSTENLACLDSHFPISDLSKRLFSQVASK